MRKHERLHSQVDYEFFAPFDEPDREANLSASESTESVSSASTAGGIASAIPSTHVTSQSPDIQSIDTNMDQLDKADTSTKPAFGASEEQVNGWVAALQRLVKGKVRVKEEVSSRVSLTVVTTHFYLGPRDAEHHPRGGRICERHPE